MNNNKKIALGAVAGIAGLAVAGSLIIGNPAEAEKGYSCGAKEEQRYLENYLGGTVLRKGGLLPRMLGTANDYSGYTEIESLNNPWLVLIADTDQGQYTIVVEDSRGQPTIALAERIESGDKIKFPLEAYCSPFPKFNKNKIGTVYSYEIDLL